VAVGAVARKHGDGQLALGLGQGALEAEHFLFGQRAHLRVGFVERGKPASSARIDWTARAASATGSSSA
jgi:hypothetical protein